MSFEPSPSRTGNIGLWLGSAAILLVALIAVVALLNRPPATEMPEPAPGDSSVTTTARVEKETATSTTTPTVTPADTPTSTPLPRLGTSNVFIEYILDASGSMTETLSDGSTKIEAAEQLLAEHIRSLRPETNIGLRVYGHRLPYQQTNRSCLDIELIAPVEKGQLERIVGFLQGFSVQGMTPLAASLEQAKDDFEYDPSRINSIVMLSDGIETCGGDPCQLVEDLKAEGVNFTVHVIGLNVDDPTREQLTCIAKAGGGKYQDARSQGDLSAALGAVRTDVTQGALVAPPGVDTPTPQPTPTPTPRTTANVSAASIAYVGTDGNIWLMDYESGEQSNLTNFSSGGASNPAWSPDGSMLAFGWHDGSDADLVILNLISGELRRVGLVSEQGDYPFPGVRMPAWTADGSTIYFSATEDSLQRYWKLRRVWTNSTSQHEIPSISDRREWEGYPAFSPDGRWMTAGLMERYYLVDWPPEYWGIWLANADESSPRKLLEGINGKTAWSPDSTRIAYDTHWHKDGYGQEGIHLMNHS